MQHEHGPVDTPHGPPAPTVAAQARTLPTTELSNSGRRLSGFDIGDWEWVIIHGIPTVVPKPEDKSSDAKLEDYVHAFAKSGDALAVSDATVINNGKGAATAISE